jgi:hypothetical protein
MRVSSASALSSSTGVKTSSSLREEDGVALARRAALASTSFAGAGASAPRDPGPRRPRTTGAPPSRRLAEDECARRAALLTEPLPFVGPFASHWGFSASEGKIVPTRRMVTDALSAGVALNVRAARWVLDGVRLASPPRRVTAATPPAHFSSNRRFRRLHDAQSLSGEIRLSPQKPNRRGKCRSL